VKERHRASVAQPSAHVDWTIDCPSVLHDVSMLLVQDSAAPGTHAFASRESGTPPLSTGLAVHSFIALQ
jgi:hypothetical protein